ncbi:hypothetical protein ACOSQ2_010572 [Xanthoceras sorbifolium]
MMGFVTCVRKGLKLLIMFCGLALVLRLFGGPVPSSLNVARLDAAMEKVINNIGIGMVVRISSGGLVLAAGLKCFHVSDVTVAEAKAILLRLQLAGSRGLFSLIVDTDSLNVVN